jgi:hypothetical protein
MLYQDSIWTTRDGRTLRLEDLTAEHRGNLMAWLVRNARRFSVQFPFHVPFPNFQGEMAQDMAEHEFFAEWDFAFRDPEEWIKSTPLYQKLEELSNQDKHNLIV